MNKVMDFLKANIKIIVLFIVIVCIFAFSLNKDTMKKKVTYTIVEGTIERSQETNLYILKKETLINYDNTLPVTAIIDQGKRASKGEAIATYKNDSYDEYLNQVAEIDKQIQTLVKDLPLTYSADIANLENKILDYSVEIQKTTSYSKMLEYKAKLDELAYKKITVLANSTPDSSAIRDLIAQRENLVRLSKESSNTISTPVNGIVTYKTDGLEDSYQYASLESYDVNQFNEIINKYDGTINSEFGIKIVDNYDVYFLTKTAKDENDQYVKQYSRYRIRISDFENKTIYASLINKLQDENYNYCLFKITNEIDGFIDYRKLSCEVVWNSVSGMAVPTNAIYKDVEKGYDYVLMVYGAEYVKVPIKIVASSDSIVIADNYSKDEIEAMGLDNRFKLELYDELIIE
ncbi:MAG: hypothetical protein IJX34_03335 [Clostridia bacterium]|nr:hypothetical protein [Clostridia bacterium]